jgi:hypothetical protein
LKSLRPELVESTAKLQLLNLMYFALAEDLSVDVI